MIDDTTKLTTWPDLALEVMGGPDIARALWRHHNDGESVRSIAASINMPESSLRKEMKEARATMKRLRIMPSKWEVASLAVTA